ncbi:hypothetical protein D6827_00205 [Candidatus Parcubacteria bacterium]|nr:MAG: hypothetical protein D6827_00205 [Candidatus Parcubacteria bacterium]
MLNKAEELVDYQVFDLSFVDLQQMPITPPENTKYLGAEIRGAADVKKLFLVFKNLRDFYNEVIYRPEAGSKAFIIYSELDDGFFVRPFDVEDLDTIMIGIVLRGSRKNIGDFIDLDDLWEKTEKDLRKFLTTVYRTETSHNKLKIKAEKINPLAFLAAIDWYLSLGIKNVILV